MGKEKKREKKKKREKEEKTSKNTEKYPQMKKSKEYFKTIHSNSFQAGHWTTNTSTAVQMK